MKLRSPDSVSVKQVLAISNQMPIEKLLTDRFVFFFNHLEKVCTSARINIIEFTFFFMIKYYF
jgi:hypothetical protein